MATIQELRALALQIRDADEPAENTALKVGQFLYDLLGYLDTKADLTPKGQWSKQLNFNQTPIVALQSVEAIPDSQGQNNKMWWSSDDGQLKWKANDEVYPLGNPTYILYYCGNKIYRWSGSTTGFVDMTPPVINNLTTGGEGDALSAEMGKWLYTNLYMIFTQLGTYAFPNGKPQIDWGGGNPPVIPPCTVSKTIGTGLSSTGGDSDVAFGDPLEVSIAITDNLYIVDDDSVVVTMGGSPVAGAWNSSTMKVTIAAVTGNVVINVPSLTYVGYGEQNSDLAFMLDCKNRGNQSGHWVDMIGNVDFTLGSGVTPADTGVEFDGTSNAKGVSSGTLEILFENATVEIVATRASASGSSPILSNTFDNGVSARTRIVGSSNSNIATFACTTPSRCSFLINEILSMALSANTSRFAIGGVVSDAWGESLHNYITKKATTLAIGYHKDLSTNEETYLNGTIKAIRVYNHGSGGTKLSADDMAHNYKVDQKRFNLS